MAFIKTRLFFQEIEQQKFLLLMLRENLWSCLAGACVLQGMGIGAAGWEQMGKAEEEKVTTGRPLQRSWETAWNNM